MSGYSTCRWTCGECGESYQADGVVGDLKVDRWAREHREMHRRVERWEGQSEEQSTGEEQ